MEVHHHSHTPRQKWTHYFWEFLMLFLAVTAGFFVENLREHIIEDQRTKRYMKGLLIDIRNNNFYLDSIIKENNIIIKQNDKLSQQIMAGGKMLDRFQFAKAYFPVYTRIFVNRNENYRQMENSGTLRYIKNLELLQSILDYQHKANLSVMRSYENERNIVMNHVFPVIMRNFDPACMQLMIPGTSTSTDSFPHSDIIKGEELIRFEKEIGNAIVLRRVVASLSLSSYLGLRKQGDELANLIKKEYHLK